jgi:AraC-like DNA-binding protein
MIIHKEDGFANEQFFVIPRNFLFELEGSPLSHFFSVTDIGYFPRAKYHYRKRPEGCDTALLIYCSSGTGTYSINGSKAEPLSASQLIIIPPNTPHEYAASQENPWSIYWVHIKGLVFDAYYDLALPHLPLMVNDVMDDRIKTTFDHCFRLLKGPYHNEEYHYLCQVITTMLALIPCAGKQSIVQYKIDENLGINKVISYMESHIKELISLQRLSEVCGYSASHLSSLFKRSTGHPPIDFFLHLKVQAAARDLCFSELPIRDIAEIYGIKDQYYFSRLFKRISGFSPSEYRLQARKE